MSNRLSSREVLYLLDDAGAVLWSELGGAAELRDSHDRWEAIWRFRESLKGIAHSHPHGPLAFSGIDETTMAAIDTALGRCLRYWVVAPGGIVSRQGDLVEIVDPEPEWGTRIRAESGMKERKP